jgi:hypothetical protein
MSDKVVRPWDLLNPRSPKSTEQTQIERITICKSCPELIKATRQCKQCGCIMPLKVLLADAFCPLGKWGSQK